MITDSNTLIIHENYSTTDSLRFITYLLLLPDPNAPVMIISSVILGSIVLKSKDVFKCATTKLSLSHPCCFLSVAFCGTISSGSCWDEIVFHVVKSYSFIVLPVSQDVACGSSFEVFIFHSFT